MFVIIIILQLGHERFFDEVYWVISLCLYLKPCPILYMMRNYETWQSPRRSVKLRKSWNSSPHQHDRISAIVRCFEKLPWLNAIIQLLWDSWYPKLNSSPLKSSQNPIGKGLSSNHHFSGAMLNFRGDVFFHTAMHKITGPAPGHRCLIHCIILLYIR